MSVYISSMCVREVVSQEKEPFRERECRFERECVCAESQLVTLLDAACCRELDVSALLACLAVSQRWRRVASDDRMYDSFSAVSELSSLNLSACVLLTSVSLCSWEELFLGSLSVHKRVHVDYSQHHVDLQLERASQWMRLYDANHGRPPRMHCRTLEGLSTRGAAENRVTSRDERVADFRRLLLQPFAITFRDAYFERKRRRQARSRFFAYYRLFALYCRRCIPLWGVLCLMKPPLTYEYALLMSPSFVLTG